MKYILRRDFRTFLTIQVNDSASNGFECPWSIFAVDDIEISDDEIERPEKKAILNYFAFFLKLFFYLLDQVFEGARALPQVL